MDADESPHGWVHGVSHKEIPEGELVIVLSTFTFRNTHNIYSVPERVPALKKVRPSASHSYAKS